MLSPAPVLNADQVYWMYGFVIIINMVLVVGKLVFG